MSYTSHTENKFYHSVTTWSDVRSTVGTTHEPVWSVCSQQNQAGSQTMKAKTKNMTKHLLVAIRISHLWGAFYKRKESFLKIFLAPFRIKQADQGLAYTKNKRHKMPVHTQSLG